MAPPPLRSRPPWAFPSLAVNSLRSAPLEEHGFPFLCLKILTPFFSVIESLTFL